MKTTVCYDIEFEHENRRIHCTIKTTAEEQFAREMVENKNCNKITGMSLRFKMEDGEIITKEIEAEDIKNVWIELLQ